MRDLRQMGKEQGPNPEPLQSRGDRERNLSLPWCDSKVVPLGDHFVARPPNRDQAVALRVVDIHHEMGRGREVGARRKEPKNARAGIQALAGTCEHRLLVFSLHRTDVHRRAVAQRHVRFPMGGVGARLGRSRRRLRQLDKATCSRTGTRFNRAHETLLGIRSAES